MSALFDIDRIAARAGSPMGRWLGFRCEAGGDSLVYRLAFTEEHIGNPMIRALHGGVIAAFLEFAMQADLAARLDESVQIATATMAVDYLASSRAEDMRARVRVSRLGRRIAFLEASGWQCDESQPVAIGRAALRIG